MKAAQRLLATLAFRWAGLGMLAAGAVGAASFDCQRARSKLNRLICSDAVLSSLDETVWNAYGERIRSLSALQYASYAAQVGDDFLFSVKAPALVTDATVRSESGRATQPNRLF